MTAEELLKYVEVLRQDILADDPRMEFCVVQALAIIAVQLTRVANNLEIIRSQTDD